jgi:hypothetical protein
MQNTINIRNTSTTGYVTYKVRFLSTQIKTTTPDLFEVNPSKGILQPSQSKTIEFKVNKVLQRTDARILIVKEKFLIQCIMLHEKKKPQEIEQLWVAYKNDPSRIENIRLKLRIDGLEAVEQLRSAGSQQPPPDLFPNVNKRPLVSDANQFGSVSSSNAFASVPVSNKYTR